MQNCLAQSDNIADFFLNFQLLLKIEKVFSCKVLPYFLYMLCRSRSHEKLTHATLFLERRKPSLLYHLQQREISFPDLWIFQEALFGFIFHCHACDGLKRAFSAPCWGSFNVQHIFFHTFKIPLLGWGIVCSSAFLFQFFATVIWQGSQILQKRCSNTLTNTQVVGSFDNSCKIVFWVLPTNR